MNIQWYPGHMAKAKRLLREQIKLIDIVLELRDARIPESSANPDLIELLGNKQRIIVLIKSDLAEPAGNKEWQSFFTKQGLPAIVISSLSRDTGQLIKLISEMTTADDKIRLAKGMNPRLKRIMVVGIPNVGKSTLVNNLAKRRTAKTGDKPGVTKGNQWVRVHKNIELLDTPGILWPKFESRKTGFLLALTGSIKEEIYDHVEVAIEFIEFMEEKEPGFLREYYKILEPFEDKDSLAKLEALGRRWGFLLSGGVIDLEKTASRLLLDFRRGKLGKFTLETPES